MRTSREQDEHDGAKFAICTGCKGLLVLYPEESDCWQKCDPYQEELQEIRREWLLEDIKKDSA